jgi:iron(III) transport system substrate-binding protein
MKNAALVFAFVAVVLGPLLLREKEDAAQRADETLVIVTPHNEATRHEFSRAFEAAHFAKTSRRVRVDWRTIGGVSEIARYLESQYLAAFQNHWTNTLRQPWSEQVRASFDNPRVQSNETPAGAARRAFLESNVTCGMDLFFGGGAFDFIQQAAAGRLVDCGVIAAHPELFNERAIPQNLSGEPMWDAQGRWVGACLASFGICYNVDALARLGIGEPPAQWADLADPKYFGQIALADPTQSGSVGKTFEMLIQQQMLQSAENRAPETQALRDGWTRALQLIQRISGNARYFTDSGAKIPFDVEMGDAAAGMCIDFYGRFQSEAVRKPDGSSRLQYVSPRGGSSVGADPIGLLRGAPHAELAREFIEFVLSNEGQKLWNFKVGAPGGPAKYALRRLPIRPELYAPEFAPFRSDPGVNPYEQAKSFVYHEQWTSPLFRVISFIVRVMCIEPHDELREAWRALIAAGFPPEATRTFHELSAVTYEIAGTQIRDTLRSPQRIDQVRLAKELGDHFRAQYRRATELARAGK